MHSIVVNIKSGSAVLPSVSFSIGIIQFRFCYWIATCTALASSDTYGPWKPDHPVVSDYTTVVPEAASDPEKMSELLDKYFDRFVETYREWVCGLTMHVSEFMDKMRGFGDIIS